MTNRVQRVRVGRAVDAVRLESPHLAVTILLDQGADLFELIHKPSAIDVLWKVPYPVREPGVGPPPAGDSMAQWIAHYRGGWQTILPNFGKAVTYRGAELDFHGEAARRPWQLDEASAGAEDARVVVSTRLLSMPLAVRREVRLDEERPIVRVQERVTNLSETSCHCMWGQHPVFGAPLIAPETAIYTSARRVLTDDGFVSLGNDLPLGSTFEWPVGSTRSGAPVDLSRMPAPGSGTSRVLWLQDFREAWYAIVNPGLPLGVGVRWNREVMPYACLWQEAGGGREFPFFGNAYALAIEPQTSYFGHGLLEAIEKTQTAVSLAPGESRTLTLTVVLVDDARPVRAIDADGTVQWDGTGP